MDLIEGDLAQVLKVPYLGVTHRDEEYMYGELDIHALLIHYMKNKPKDSLTIEVTKYLEEELPSQQWEYCGFTQVSNSKQTRKYKKKI